MAAQDVHLSAFIDNSNHGIKYQGDWTHISGLSTDLRSLISPINTQSTPWYGTVSVSTAPKAQISYTFNGTGFLAFFRNTNTTSITSCTIDGHEQAILPSLEASTFCANNTEISSGQHDLTIMFNGKENFQFDGLLYTPTSIHSFDSGEVDVLYDSLIPGGIRERLWVTSTGNGGEITNPGDFLQVDFNGIALSIYAKISFVNSNPTPLQYMIDNHERINFTLATLYPNAFSIDSGFQNQLILQTPRLTSGRHQLQLSILSMFGYQSVSLYITQIIVQNSSDSVDLNLDVVPPVFYSSTATGPTLSSPLPSVTNVPAQLRLSSRINQTTILAIALSTFAFFLLLIGIILCVRRRVRTPLQTDDFDGSNNRAVISPFIIPPTAHLGGSLGWPPHRILWGKRHRYNGIGILPRTINLTHETNRRQNRPHRVRYIIHQDGGEVADPSNEVGQEEDVSNLPPLYSTIGAFLPVSLTQESAPQALHSKS